MSDGRSGYVPTLDGWRAIAIAGVIVAHGADTLLSPQGALPNTTWHALTRYGALGVDLFFGISGLLICSRLLEEEERRGRISLAGFYIRRFCRILPPYFMYLLVVGVAGLLGVFAIHRSEFLSCVFFVRNYLPAPYNLGWYTAHLWSLAVEEHFYLLWPGILFLAGSRRARPLVIVLALALAAWRVLEFRLQLVPRLLPGALFYERTDIRLDALLWGCAAALALRVPAWRASLERWLSTGAWLLLVAAFVGCVAYHPPLAMLWQSILIPLVLLGPVLHPAGYMGRFLETGVMRWVGRVSYSLYLWQQLFLVGAQAAHPLPLGLLQSLPLNLAALLACAALSYYAIERPMIRVGHRLAAPVTPGRE
jgi:peptidoglycan/LPS O-acetylase OafA/YrhL